jgi:hypothetical protein
VRRFDGLTTTSTQTTPSLSDEDLVELLALIEGADSAELKLTVPVSDRSRAGSALGVDPLDGQIRQVYFFDTPDLALNKRGLVVRARRVQRKGDDSVVKLRPVVPEELPTELCDSSNSGVEVDAMPGGYVCSGSMKRTLGQRPSRTSSRERKRFASSSPRSSGPCTPLTRPRGSSSRTFRSWGRSSC